MTEVWDEEAERRLSSEPLGLEEPEEDVAPTDALLALLTGQRLYKEEIRFGQAIRLRSLKMGEELECGLVVQRYNGTPEEGRAYTTALVGAAIESVDGLPIVETLGPMSDDERVRRQFEYVRKNWYWPHIQIIYEEIYLPLLREVGTVLAELQLK